MGKPTQERLCELFEDIGHTLKRKVSRGKAAAGSVITQTGNHGYLRVRVDGEYYLVHRLLWRMRTGVWPDRVDHIDRNPLNNRADNLREVTHAQNMQNTKMQVNNTSGHRGVSWHKASQKWIVQINNHGKSTYGGLHHCKETAIKTYNQLQQSLHGAYAGGGVSSERK